MPGTAAAMVALLALPGLLGTAEEPLQGLFDLEGLRARWQAEVNLNLGLPQNASVGTDRDGQVVVSLPSTCLESTAWQECNLQRLQGVLFTLRNSTLNQTHRLDALRVDCAAACVIALPLAATPVVPLGPAPPPATSAPATQAPAAPDAAPRTQTRRMAEAEDLTLALVATIVPAAAAVTVGLLPYGPWGAALRRTVGWKWLARTGWVALGLYSRIRGDDLLEHETRRAMHDLLVASPGSNIQDLKSRLAIAWGTAVYHLERLERAQVVVSHRVGNHRRYYVSGSGAARARASWGVLHNETARRLAMAVMANPGATQQDLCSQIGVRHPVASKHLKRLEHHALIRTETAHRYRLYYPTSSMLDLAGHAQWDGALDEPTSTESA
jgi:DNA-binding MarR family transcriptional regulator